MSPSPNFDDNNDEVGKKSFESLVVTLQAKADLLLAELRSFQDCLKEHGKQNEVEVKVFRRAIEAEVKILQNYAKQYVTMTTASDSTTMRDSAGGQNMNNDQDEDYDAQGEPRYVHALRSSNLPFYEAIWRTAKQRRGLVALEKRFYTLPPGGIIPPEDRSPRDPNSVRRRKKKGVMVDIVADEGREWIKVSNITEKRLLLEMAKEGWDTYGDYSSDDENGNDNDDNTKTTSNTGTLELVRLATSMVHIARAHRAKFQHPKVIFVLPKVKEGSYDDIDALIADVRGIGATVICANTTAEHNNNYDLNIATDKLNLSDDGNNNNNEHFDFTRLLPTPSSTSKTDLTPTLNIDCTILLALVSDISHVPRDALPTFPSNQSGSYHTAIVKQIESEEKLPLLPNEIYPAFDGRDLVCTNHAAQRMIEIVMTMGTATERIRKDIFLGLGEEYTGREGPELRTALSKHSVHETPGDLRLPIKIINFDLDSLPFRDGPPSSFSTSESDLAPPSTTVTTITTTTTTTINNKDITTTNNNTGNLPAQEFKVAMSVPSKLTLPVINKSVFTYGWLHRHDTTTITSNRVMVHNIMKAIHEVLDDLEKEEKEEGKEEEEFQGPKIRVFEAARSLVGKEKQGNRKTNKR